MALALQTRFSMKPWRRLATMHSSRSDTIRLVSVNHQVRLPMSAHSTVLTYLPSQVQSLPAKPAAPASLLASMSFSAIPKLLSAVCSAIISPARVRLLRMVTSALKQKIQGWSRAWRLQVRKRPAIRPILQLQHRQLPILAPAVRKVRTVLRKVRQI